LLFILQQTSDQPCLLICHRVLLLLQVKVRIAILEMEGGMEEEAGIGTLSFKLCARLFLCTLGYDTPQFWI
jgi:hypothetical protein